MNSEFVEILAALKQPFKPEQHIERPLPGGKRWFFITWQDIRERLDEVYPEWSCTWSEPSYIGDYCHISCTITIAGVSRQAPGNAPIQLISNEGKDMARGTPIERATADAFKNAAEAFGIARYLDDQTKTVNLLHKQGDGRAYKFAKENEQIQVGARGITKQPTGEKLITEPQAKRLWAIAKKLNLSDQEIHQVITNYGFSDVSEISMKLYDKVIEELQNLSAASF
ncbi:Rad52/Rad22 family DNA repair protein [Aphanizomenon flos-aquae]|uniref:Rad52/Rad22 family DNA repair protein n=1 Tax=Aphanizomenon flos-aquae TaxID=1176 RepID=UPI0004B2D2F3|nr:Rad52/Rad22 family DNA repair protein [Aphanizomenon flos-aquae]